MRVLTLVSLLITLQLVSCTDGGIGSVEVENVVQVNFRPVGRPAETITNAVELAIIGKWLNETSKKRISAFDLKSYPKAVHEVSLQFKSGEPRTFLISGGSVSQTFGQSNAPKLFERLTILSFEGRQFF